MDLKNNITKYFLDMDWYEYSLCNKAYKKNLFTEEFWSNSKKCLISMQEDFLQNCELLFTVKNFLLAEEILYNYRRHNDSMVHTTLKSQKSRERDSLDLIRKQEYIIYKFKKENINDDTLNNFSTQFYENILKKISFIRDKNKQYEFLKLINEKKLILINKKNQRMWVRIFLHLIERKRYKFTIFLLKTLRRSKRLILWFKY